MRQPANNVTGDSEQAGLVEPSHTAFKRTRLDSEINARLVAAEMIRQLTLHTSPRQPANNITGGNELAGLDDNLDLARRARERRDNILEAITNLDQLPVAADKIFDANIPFCKAAVQLSDPAFYDKLPFPFVGAILPDRFNTSGKKNGDMWFYMGREKFKELVERVENMQRSNKISTLWLYGTKGYGKSHILATLVCHLAGQGKRVIYIPDYRECVKDSAEYFRTAMYFAWADDENMQKKIMALKSLEEIYKFLKRHKDVILVIDQMNGLEELREESAKLKEKKGELSDYLERFRASHKAVLSTSANNRSFLLMQVKQTSDAKMRVYGGLTTVSLNKNSFAKWDFSNY